MMALHIPPIAVSRPLFRRLVRSENEVIAMDDDTSENGGESELIHVPHSFRYPQAMMNIEDMTILLETTLMPATSDAQYEDAPPAIDQYSFEFSMIVPVPSVAGAIVSRQA